MSSVFRKLERAKPMCESVALEDDAWDRIRRSAAIAAVVRKNSAQAEAAVP